MTSAYTPTATAAPPPLARAPTPPPGPPAYFTVTPKRANTFAPALRKTNAQGEDDANGTYGVWGAGWVYVFEVEHLGALGDGFVGVIQNTRGKMEVIDKSGKATAALSEAHWTHDPNTDEATVPWFHKPVPIKAGEKVEVLFADLPGIQPAPWATANAAKMAGKMEFAWWLVFHKSDKNIARPQDLDVILDSGTFVIDWAAHSITAAGNPQPHPHTVT